jgi:hypothetical protein
MATAPMQPQSGQPGPTGTPAPLQGSIPVSSVVAAASGIAPVRQVSPVSSGSPESGPARSIPAESNTPAPEYGYEVIKQIEKAAEVERPEVKEPRPVVPQPAPQPVTELPGADAPKSALPPEKPTLALPKYLGHKIPEELTQNLDAVSSEKGKGDPNLARTAIYFFLDRLLRKQAGQPAK